MSITKTGYRPPPMELATLPTIAETLPSYQGWLRGRKLSERTIETYRKGLVRFDAWLGEQLGDAPTVGDVTTPWIELFQQHIADRKAATVIKFLTMIKSYSRWCMRSPHRYRIDDPTQAIDWPKKNRPLPRALSAEQLAKLEAALNAPIPVLDAKRRRCRIRDRLALLTLLYTGARRAEALDILWTDVNMEDRLITIRHGKGDRARVCPIHERLYAALAEVPEPQRVGYVIGGKGGRKLSHNALGHLFDRRGSWLRTQYGLEGGSCHSLRHTFATRAVQQGVDLSTLQELMGHQDPKDTSRYVRVTGAQTRAAIDKLPERFAGGAPDPTAPMVLRQRNPLLSAVCAECEAVFESRSRASRFCSKLCKSRYYRAHGPVQAPTHCEHCGEPLIQTGKGAKRRFCGESCRQGYHTAQQQEGGTT